MMPNKKRATNGKAKAREFPLLFPVAGLSDSLTPAEAKRWLASVPDALDFLSICASHAEKQDERQGVSAYQYALGEAHKAATWAIATGRRVTFTREEQPGLSTVESLALVTRAALRAEDGDLVFRELVPLVSTLCAEIARGLALERAAEAERDAKRPKRETPRELDERLDRMLAEADALKAKSKARREELLGEVERNAVALAEAARDQLRADVLTYEVCVLGHEKLGYAKPSRPAPEGYVAGVV